MKFSMFIHPPSAYAAQHDRCAGAVHHPIAVHTQPRKVSRHSRNISDTVRAVASPRVTIAQVADAAGVSVPTVCKVVNGRSDVAPETRERVERMLREHGYKRPAPQAHASLLDVVFNELESPWAMEIIKGVEEVARENELGVVLSAQEGPGALGPLLGRCRRRPPLRRA